LPPARFPAYHSPFPNFGDSALYFPILKCTVTVIPGANATLTTAQFLYNAATRELFYDLDGTGAGAKALLATLQAGASVTATNIIVI
jgi:hypothetical protein